MNKLRIGLIGCGGIAHLKHLPALAKLKHRVELVAFCDLIEERAVGDARVFGDPGATTHTDYPELLKNESIDAVYIMTPNVSHAEITIAALEAGKHVMCEKPMAINSLEARAMLEAAQRTGKKLTIAYQNRFRADSQSLYRASREGRLGDVYLAKAHAIRRKAVPTWGVFSDKGKQGGGPLIDIGTHALDIALWAMGNYRPKLVMGSVFNKMRNNFEGNLFGPWSPAVHDVEDSAFGMIRMENGATIFLEASWALNVARNHEGQVMLCGDRGGAEMVGEGVAAPTSPVRGTGRVVINTAQSGELVDISPFQASGGGPADFGGDPFRVGDAESTAWLDAIEKDTDPFVKPEEALVVTEILEAIYQSAEKGEAIRL